MAAETWSLTIKPSFLAELVALAPKEAAQVQKKLALLAEDPRPDAKTKKQLKHLDGKLHRLRSGDFRVFYTFEAPYISVLALRRRSEDTYDDELEPELLGGADLSGASASAPASASPSAAAASAPAAGPADRWARWLGPPPKKTSTPLPRAIDRALLESLAVPRPFHEALCAAATEDELLDCPVPQDVLIYTAAPDSEGTFGGLVRLGMADELGRHLELAIEDMRPRSALALSDPRAGC